MAVLTRCVFAGLGPEPFIINFQTEMQHPSLSTSVEDTAAVEQVLEPHQNSSPATRVRSAVSMLESHLNFCLQLCDIDVAWIKSASQKHAEMQVKLDKVATKTGGES